MSVLAAFMVPHPPMIVPAVGRGSERQVEETTKAYERVADEIAALRPETIVITSPHSVMYADYFHISPGSSASGSFAGFGARDVSFSEDYDTELVSEIARLADEEGLAAGTLGERDPALDHGTMVPLWFIRGRYKEGRIVRIGLSGLPYTDHYRLGMLIREAAENTGRRIVIVASGDLSHKLQDYGPYGYVPEGPEYDERIMDVMGRAAFDELLDFDETFCDKAAECGQRSFVIMAGAFDGTAVRSERLSHQDITGVGYGICTFYPEGPDESRHFLDSCLAKEERMLEEKRASSDAYVNLARDTIEAWVTRGEKISLPQGLPQEMLETRAGAFVSIHKQGQLRGCIGTIAPTASCVAQEIINNAISASTRDPRFAPVRPDELKWLEINVDVLGEPEDIASRDELDVKRYGVIVTSGRKRGLLLPDLDGVDSVDQQVEIAMQKGGIHKSERYSLQRFEVIRHV
ncbi:MAG: AmmeMemoRadiSam system protein A [Clostridiales bacterium]|jgi:AmmeMemoRadiSam system protein A/AmmeMemoRadiSam system protein B|nr:AmmeMemoRadiSam system protein A [Clostridiales bacterium]